MWYKSKAARALITFLCMRPHPLTVFGHTHLRHWFFVNLFDKSSHSGQPENACWALTLILLCIARPFYFSPFWRLNQIWSRARSWKERRLCRHSAYYICSEKCASACAGQKHFTRPWRIHKSRLALRLTRDIRTVTCDWMFKNWPLLHSRLQYT